MRKIVPWIAALTFIYISLPEAAPLQENAMCLIPQENQFMESALSSAKGEQDYPNTAIPSLFEIKAMLLDKNANLSPDVINKVLTTLECAENYLVHPYTNLTIIDFSLPSNEKRLWVFSLMDKKLLFNTYVSHGIKSGTLFSDSFSNQYNSKSSSIGIYQTEKSYIGRHGLSLQLEGLDSGYNDRAASRAIVMHGGWYVDEPFIKKYGRAGRSWGCPAIPSSLTEPIINTIKEDSLFVAYYPDDRWFVKSKFLNCHRNSLNQQCESPNIVMKGTKENEVREDVLFADLNQDNQHEENEPVVVISADDYARFFEAKIPLNRMLRRQINQVEYIVLSQEDFGHLDMSNNKDALSAISFVVPEVTMQRGYYATEMKPLPYGKITEASLNSPSNPTQHKSYTVHCEIKPILQLKSTNQFIRWVGL